MPSPRSARTPWSSAFRGRPEAQTAEGAQARPGCRCSRARTLPPHSSLQLPAHPQPFRCSPRQRQLPNHSKTPHHNSARGERRGPVVHALKAGEWLCFSRAKRLRISCESPRGWKQLRSEQACSQRLGAAFVPAGADRLRAGPGRGSGRGLPPCPAPAFNCHSNKPTARN